MQTNHFIKVMSYLTYLSILFHAIDGIMLAVQNKKARPVQYAMNNAKANSSSASRKMAVLGSIIFIFIATHMVNFWAKMHFGGLSLHKVELSIPESEEKQELYLTTSGSFLSPEQVEVRDGNQFYDKQFGLKLGEGYKDLHSNVMAFFSGKDVHGVEGNKLAWLAVLLYTVSMAVLSFHLMHGFAAAFQSLGVRHPKYTSVIANAGKLFSVVVPALFAIIPLYIFFS